MTSTALKKKLLNIFTYKIPGLPIPQTTHRKRTRNAAVTDRKAINSASKNGGDRMDERVALGARCAMIQDFFLTQAHTTI